MITTDYLAAITASGISHYSVEWETTVKPAAAHKARVLTKVSTAVCMTGAEYKGLAVNAGTETGELPWGQWSMYPFIITHKGTDYARLYTVDNTVRTTYLIDGVVSKREDFLALLTPSQQNPSRPNGGTITVTMANVKAVGEPAFA